MNKKHFILPIILIFVVLIAVSLVAVFHSVVKEKNIADDIGGDAETEKVMTDLGVDESSSSQPAGTGAPVVNPFSDEQLLLYAKNVYYGIYYFDDAAYYCNKSEKTPSASVIKVFIMEYIYTGASEGKINLEETVGNQSVEALVKKMIQNSDNQATNTLIDRFGMDAVNEYIKANGYTQTVLERKMLDNAAREAGLDNYTSLDDVMRFLKKLYNNRDNSPYREMLEIMKGQTVRTKIPLFLPENVVVANKTGELENVENDIGIVFSDKSAFAVAVLTNNTVNSAQTRIEIGRLAEKAYEFLLTNYAEINN